MEFTNDELQCLINALSNYWTPNEEDLIDELIEKLDDKLKEQRMWPEWQRLLIGM